MKNYKTYIIIGSFALAGILLWYFLRPTNEEGSTVNNPYLKSFPEIHSGENLLKKFQEKNK